METENFVEAKFLRFLFIQNLFNTSNLRHKIPLKQFLSKFVYRRK